MIQKSSRRRQEAAVHCRIPLLALNALALVAAAPERVERDPGDRPEAGLPSASAGDNREGLRDSAKAGAHVFPLVELKQPLCGQYALYLAAHALGRDEVQFAHILALLPPTPEGRSMLELDRAATELGLYGRAVRFQPEALRTFKGVGILYLRAEGAMPGHFICVRSVSGGQLQLIPFECKPVLVSKEDWSRPTELWRGEILWLARTRRGLDVEEGPPGILAWGVLAGAALALFGLGLRRWTMRPALPNQGVPEGGRRVE